MKSYLHVNVFLRYFHVVDGIVPDVMHDILEGTLQLHIKWLLKHFINTGRISLATFNSRLKSFHYGPSDISNKPTPIAAETLFSSTNTIKQSC